MYQPFFGLHDRPFDLTPDARFLFLSKSHKEALSNLQYGLRSRKGLTLLLGDAGMGKTTLVRAVLSSLQERDARCVYLNNPTLTRAEFVRFLANGFGLTPAAAIDKTICLQELERLLAHRAQIGALSALMIDEAQSLPYELLEEVRLLANMETDTTKLLPLILAGQPELSSRLNERSLRQLKQRVVLRCELQPFDVRQTAGYIATRLRAAGGDAARIFTREAVCLIHDVSRGIPRLISVVCDNALMAGFAAQTRPVGSALVREVCRDFDLASPFEVAEPVFGNGSASEVVSQTDAGQDSSVASGEAEPEPELLRSAPKARGTFFS